MPDVVDPLVQLPVGELECNADGSVSLGLADQVQDVEVAGFQTEVRRSLYEDGLIQCKHSLGERLRVIHRERNTSLSFQLLLIGIPQPF